MIASEPEVASQLVSGRVKKPEDTKTPKKTVSKPYVEILKRASAIEKDKNNKPVYTPPHKRAEPEEEEKESEDSEKSDEEESDEEGGEEELPVPPKEAPAVSRPFEKVVPVNQNKLPNAAELVPPKKSKNAAKVRTEEEDKKEVNEMLERLQGPERVTGAEERIAKNILEGSVTLQNQDILTASPAVKKIVSRVTTHRKVKTRLRNTLWLDKGKPVRNTHEGKDEPYYAVDDFVKPVFEILSEPLGELPAGAIIHRDSVEMFLQDNPDARNKKIIIVARDSHDLRVTYPRIKNNDQMVECIMDSGSQIVSMDARVAAGLDLPLNANIRIHMQSANGGLNRTLGMATNVPFRFGDITIYLQVHVIENCPYEVLVGRPFDVLCETEIKNTRQGYQSITLSDPNSRERCTIWTYPRGHRPRIEPPPRETLVPIGPPDGEDESPPVDQTTEVKEPEVSDKPTSSNFQAASRNC
jgi:hypothetical protein